MKYLLMNLAMLSVTFVEANVEKGSQPGTINITQFGDSKTVPQSKPSLPKPTKPSKSFNRR